MRVSEIRVKQIRVNQGLGVLSSILVSRYEKEVGMIFFDTYFLQGLKK